MANFSDDHGLPSLRKVLTRPKQVIGLTLGDEDNDDEEENDSDDDTIEGS
jgi:hypothetical protein